MIVSAATLAAFVPMSLALNILPGADMTFCLAQGLRGGARAGIAASAGVAAGCVIAAGVAGAGIGAVVAAGEWLAHVVRAVGAAYLLLLAVRSWRETGPGDQPLPKVAAGAAFRDGMAVNLTNPKVILFILAFVPQFVDFAKGAVIGQFLILGGVIALGGFVINGAVGSFAGGLGRALLSSGRARMMLSRATALIFAALAARLLWEFIA